VTIAEFSEPHHEESEFSFAVRAGSALGISVIADGLDYVGAPIFALPLIGDIADLVVTGLLYRITKSKASIFINAIEFIPFIGDFVPTYTISTLIWILRESSKRKDQSHRIRAEKIPDEPTSAEIIRRNQADNHRNESENLETRIMRASAILRSRIS
jgi:hypothetical protein